MFESISYFTLIVLELWLSLPALHRNVKWHFNRYFVTDKSMTFNTIVVIAIVKFIKINTFICSTSRDFKHVTKFGWGIWSTCCMQPAYLVYRIRCPWAIIGRFWDGSPWSILQGHTSVIYTVNETFVMTVWFICFFHFRQWNISAGTPMAIQWRWSSSNTPNPVSARACATRQSAMHQEP